MSQANVELVRRVLEHFTATGELPWEMFDEAIEVYDHDSPDQGAYLGHAGYQRWLDDWGSAWAEWGIALEELIDAGNSVLAIIRMSAKGRGSGVEVERQDALVYELRNGKIVRCDYYNNKEQALKAVGLEE
jgi:ketosteroid isomerase-like protein